MGKTYGSSPTPGEPETKTERTKPASVDKDKEYAESFVKHKELERVCFAAVMIALVVLICLLSTVKDVADTRLKEVTNTHARDMDSMRNTIEDLKGRVFELEMASHPQSVLSAEAQKAVDALQNALGKYATATVAYHKDLVDFAKAADQLKGALKPSGDANTLTGMPAHILKAGWPLEGPATVSLGQRNGIKRWAAMQSDCNFVVYESTGFQGVEKAVWATGTNRRGNDHRCSLKFQRFFTFTTAEWHYWLEVCEQEKCETVSRDFARSKKSELAQMSFDSITTDTGVALVSF